MDYQQLEKEFDRILTLPLWQRPIELSQLAKKHKISITSLKASFDSFWNQRLRENQQNKR